MAKKWAAGAYLAKAYLYQKKYAEAKAVFDQVIASGKTSNGLTYGLLDKYNEIFYAQWENHKESVFAIQMVSHDGTNGISNANDGNMLNFPYNRSEEHTSELQSLMRISYAVFCLKKKKKDKK